jgi:HSP20 family protein
MLVPFDFEEFPDESALTGLCGWVNPMDIACEDWKPASDVAETDKAYLVTMELPGIDMKKLDITFEDGAVTVRGEKEKETFEGECCHCSERFSGPFTRRIDVAGNVERDKIDATYKDGILKLVLPKSEESIPKKIEVH